MNNNKNDIESFLSENAEEIALTLKESVIDPLEETTGLLEKVWTDDKAAEVFLTRLAVHQDTIQEAYKQLKIASQVF